MLSGLEPIFCIIYFAQYRKIVPRQTKALELGYIVMEQGENLVSALVSASQYSRQKYMPLRHVQLRI
jgi:hypothetical protein